MHFRPLVGRKHLLTRCLPVRFPFLLQDVDRQLLARGLVDRLHLRPKRLDRGIHGGESRSGREQRLGQGTLVRQQVFGARLQAFGTQAEHGLKPFPVDRPQVTTQGRLVENLPLVVQQVVRGIPLAPLERQPPPGAIRDLRSEHQVLVRVAKVVRGVQRYAEENIANGPQRGTLARLVWTDQNMEVATVAWKLEFHSGERPKGVQGQPSKSHACFLPAFLR